jgi:hypothetical protein
VKKYFEGKNICMIGISEKVNEMHNSLFLLKIKKFGCSEKLKLKK